MTKVVGVRFSRTGRVYYFDPADMELKRGDNVIVETSRGTEYGTVTFGNTFVDEADITKPLKKVMKMADESDTEIQRENDEQKPKAMEICREKITKHGLDMKLIDVEYTFDGSKIIFYFISDGRVDFRDLVKDLAGSFHRRIELRQIGVRDEARMIGGIGSCGKSLCCATWMNKFHPVSIKMAKNQNLSLNPTKISGVCGRLMCCLNFENEVYQQLRKNSVKINEKVKTPNGIGKVKEVDLLRGKAKVCIYADDDEEGEDDSPQGEIIEFDAYELERFSKQNALSAGDKKKNERRNRKTK